MVENVKNNIISFNICKICLHYEKDKPCQLPPASIYSSSGSCELFCMDNRLANVFIRKTTKENRKLRGEADDDAHR